MAQAQVMYSGLMMNWSSNSLSRELIRRVVLVVLVLWCACGCCGVEGWGSSPSGGNNVVVPALILFGDSTVDVGNNNFLGSMVRSDFLPYGRDFDTRTPTGRFTNGRMVADFVATRLGLPMSLPYLHPNATGQNIVKGINFASAASGYLNTTSSFLKVAPAFTQLEMFEGYKVKLAGVVGPAKASSIVSEALYFVSAGSNDYILNYFVNPVLQNRYSVSEFNALLLSRQTEFVTKLHTAGARKIGILGFPPVGCIPAQITIFGSIEQKTCVEDQNAVAVAYNKGLQAAIPKWQASLPGSQLLYLDTYSLLYDIFNNPSKYGYTSTRRACCGEGLISTAGFCNENSIGTCSDASKYVFFDSLHPTQSIYKRAADVYHGQLVSYFKIKSAF
ncbi:hypothetical protein M758_7G046200 [Ceratodon purpureus]|uniref:Uncharacterized protein n=1 Tax=Ceratodon purpureus TaxID=3225 RepID=A0A8T0H7R7_CERPU|nr:hypothetical protein KC19_7G050200 [Ceratodon purpureus]KAG0610202.1 hypothetical protein M758_7G046200 [Ceratodon purpureus]